jgi:hypothetical protein
MNDILNEGCMADYDGCMEGRKPVTGFCSRHEFNVTY